MFWTTLLRLLRRRTGCSKSESSSGRVAIVPSSEPAKGNCQLSSKVCASVGSRRPTCRSLISVFFRTVRRQASESRLIRLDANLLGGSFGSLDEYLSSDILKVSNVGLWLMFNNDPGCVLGSLAVDLQQQDGNRRFSLE